MAHVTPTTLSFRAAPEFAQETRELAKRAGLSSSDYVREAVREKNARMMAERMAFLSRQLSARSLAENEAMADTAEDGLA
ncbi:antitoxin of toxin-antitoxin stability system [Cupriavidus necator]